MAQALDTVISNLAERLEALEANSTESMFADPLAMAPLASAMQRARQAAFPEGYFADPSWEILLDLFQSKRENKKLIVSDLGLSADIAQTTVLRHLNRLVDDGFVSREDHPFDRRKSLVRLTDHGSNVVIGVFQATAMALSKQQQQKRTHPIIY